MLFSVLTCSYLSSAVSAVGKHQKSHRFYCDCIFILEYKLHCFLLRCIIIIYFESWWPINNSRQLFFNNKKPFNVHILTCSYLYLFPLNILIFCLPNTVPWQINMSRSTNKTLPLFTRSNQSSINVANYPSKSSIKMSYSSTGSSKVHSSFMNLHSSPLIPHTITNTPITTKILCHIKISAKSWRFFNNGDPFNNITISIWQQQLKL